MKEYTSPLKLSDITTISLFLGRLEKVLIFGGIVKPFSHRSLPKIISDKDLWRMLQLHGKVPRLKHWVCLGLPCYDLNEDTLEMTFDRWQLLEWCRTMDYIIDTASFRIDKPMPKRIKVPKFFKDETDMRTKPEYLDEDFSDDTIFINEEKTLRISEERKKIILRGFVKDWNGLFTGCPDHPSYSEYDSLLEFWRHFYWAQLCEISDRLKFMVGVSNADVFGAEVFFSQESFTHSLWFIPKMEFKDFLVFAKDFLQHFGTYEPFVEGGFLAIKDKSKISKADKDLNDKETADAAMTKSREREEKRKRRSRY